MDKNKFETIGGEVSRLGFGLMRLPVLDGDDGKIDIDRLCELVDCAIEGGVNYFDTAYNYHAFQAEAAAGKALIARHPRESFQFATKMPLPLCQSPEDPPRFFEEQLARTGAGYFDFYLLHNVNKKHYAIAEQCGVYDYLRRQKEAGRIRHLGFSFHDTPELLEQVLDAHEWDFVQIQLNYLDWTLQKAKEQYEIITARGLPVVVMEPLRGGSLATLADEAVEIFRQADPQASPASWGLRYVASLPGVMCVLSGMSNLEQLRDNIATFSPVRPLDEADRAVIDRALKIFLAAGSVPCTGCRYCMPCPSGVDIPGLFAAYNQHKISNSPYALEVTYRLLGREHTAPNCVQCGVCAPKCPQHIEIPDLLPQVHEAYLEAKETIKKLSAATKD